MLKLLLLILLSSSSRTSCIIEIAPTGSVVNRAVAGSSHEIAHRALGSVTLDHTLSHDTLTDRSSALRGLPAARLVGG